MKILNKFIWSKTEPKNKNDVWFDGSVFKLFKEEEWQAFTLPVDAAEKVAEVIKNASEVYQEKLEAGYGIVIEDNVISVIAPDWNANFHQKGFVKNRTHYFNAGTILSPFAWNIDNTSNPKQAIISLQKDYIYGIEYNGDTVHIKTDVTEDFTKSIYNRGITSIFHKCLGGNNTLELLSYIDSNLDTSFLKIYGEPISNAFSLGNLKQLEEIFIPDTIARKSDLENITSELLVNVTYNELKSLRDNSQLIPGQQYRITDYITTTIQENTQSAGHPFDVIVLALNENTLAEEAYATQSERDTDGYFANSNLSAWKLRYSLDNDTKQFVWANAESGKGTIYYMKDEWDNECPYDFKNIKFKRGILDTGEMVEHDEADMLMYFYTFSYKDASNNIFDTSIIGNNGNILNDEGVIPGVLNNTIKELITEDSDFTTYTTQQLNDIVFYAYYESDSGTFYGYSNNKFEEGGWGNTILDGCVQNTFGMYCHKIKYHYGCYNNNVAKICSNITFLSGCNENTLSIGCNNITLKELCSCNIFEQNCSYNELGNACHYNIFRQHCSENKLGQDCVGNTFDIECYNNIFQNNCCYNTLGSKCRNNTFGESNEGDMFWNNTLENNVSDNLFISHPTSHLTKAQYYHICSGVSNDVGIIRGTNYKTTIALDSNGNIRYFCESDLSTQVTELSADVGKKQDTITDLETIRSGASKGATAIQSVKTINGESIEGEGDITIVGGGNSVIATGTFAEAQEKASGNDGIWMWLLNDVEIKKPIWHIGNGVFIDAAGAEVFIENIEPEPELDVFKYTAILTQDNDTIVVPIVPGKNYNMVVDWGDGSAEQSVSGTIGRKTLTHTYSGVAGTKYQIILKGVVPGLIFGGDGTYSVPAQLYSIDENTIQNEMLMGDNEVTNPISFGSCINLVSISANALHNVLYKNRVSFANCSSLRSLPTRLLDGFEFTSLSYFVAGCSVLELSEDFMNALAQKISGVKSLFYAFQGCKGKIHIPDNFFDNVGSGVIDVRQMTQNSTGVTGDAKKLYDSLKTKMTTENVIGCFSGANLSNRDQVPTTWGGTMK